MADLGASPLTHEPFFRIFTRVGLARWMMVVKNKLHIGGSILFLMVAAFGCQSVASRDAPIKKLILIDQLVDGRERLFSRYGFWILEEALRVRLLVAYEPAGALNRPKLRELLPEAQISERGNFVFLTIKGSAFPDMVLSDNWLVSFDPKLDPIITELSNGADQGRSRLPVVPIRPMR